MIVGLPQLRAGDLYPYQGSYLVGFFRNKIGNAGTPRQRCAGVR